MMHIPAKLCKGDEIRIIAPSRSMSILSEEGIVAATARLEALGFRVTFGQHVYDCDLHSSSSIRARLADLHDAFTDDNVKAILTAIGGFNSNELLPYIDYDVIKNHPKILCGYSDITALANAITAHCHLITYSGPHFSSFQMEELQTYQTEFFMKCLTQHAPYDVTPSEQWSDDAWYLPNCTRSLEQTAWRVYTEGVANGRLFGGNLCTLNLLQGTPHMPPLQNSIVCIEDDEGTNPETFARDLASLLQYAPTIKGLLIGRFQRTSNMSDEQLRFILEKHPQLQTIPVMYNMDFGHTQPIVTLPIGGTVHIDTTTRTLQLLHF